MYACTRACTYIYMYIYTHEIMYVCMYGFVYVCLCVSMCVYITLVYISVCRYTYIQDILEKETCVWQLQESWKVYIAVYAKRVL